MTDSLTCSRCGAAVPPAAAFCTSCGQPITATPPEAPGDADVVDVDVVDVVDATRIEAPGLHDSTQVLAAPPAPPAPPSAAPWAPPTDTPPPGFAAPPVPAAAAPPSAPAGWQQPAPPPAPPSGFAGTGAPGSPPDAWGAPGSWGPPTASPASATSSRSPLGSIAAIGGGALTLSGVFSGWVTLGVGNDTVTDSAISLTTGDGFLKTSTPYVIVGLAAAAIVVGVLLLIGIARPLVRIGAIAVGIGIVAATALSWNEIATFVTDNFASDFDATTSIGFYLAIGGGILTALGGLLPAKKS